MDYLLISDIHASHEAFKKLIDNYWNPETQNLILLGDYIDRGTENVNTIRYIMSLKEKYPEKVQAIKGNHDCMFLDYVNSPTDIELKYKFIPYNRLLMIEIYDYDLKKFKKDSHKWRRKTALYKFGKEIRFLNSLPYYYETEHFICVHAGLNLLYLDWKNTSNEEFIWIREQFYKNPQPAPKRTFFGHTPTPLIRGNNDSSIWISPKGDKVGIDGGYTLGCSLNGVLVNEFGEVLDVYSIKNDKV